MFDPPEDEISVPIAPSDLFLAQVRSSDSDGLHFDSLPATQIEIDEIKVLYDLLLKSGASIHEMNIVRKHVCDLKGGKLAEEIEHINSAKLFDRMDDMLGYPTVDPHGSPKLDAPNF